MKKVLLMVAFLLGVKEIANGQEIFVSATNKSMDGYISVGYVQKGWGVFLGSAYNDNNLVNYKSGAISERMKYGIIKTITEDKWIVGAGVQPTDRGNKLNAFVGYNPLKSKDMKLWLIGNIVGDVFTPGLGLSYKLK